VLVAVVSITVGIVTLSTMGAAVSVAVVVSSETGGTNMSLVSLGTGDCTT
jgi:hypothetical protein